MPGPSTSPNLQHAQFIKGLSEATGLDPKVVEAWVNIEGADAPGGTGGFNYLNVRARGSQGYSGVPIPSTSRAGFAQFASVGDAITETAYWINSMPNYSSIRSATHLGPKSQLAAIAASPWDAGHYNGGRSLYDAYNAITSGGASIVGTIISRAGKVGIDAATNPFAIPGDVLGSWNPGGVAGGLISASEAPGKIAESAVSVAGDAAKVAGFALNPNNWLRVGYIIGGGVMVLLGTVLLAKSVGALNIATPAAPELKLMSAGQRQAESAYANRSYRSSHEGISKADSKGKSVDTGIGRRPRKPKAGSPGSTKLAPGDTIPF